jgi:hypothetical protein
MEHNNSRRGNFIGHDGFVWWIGTVESRMDPLNCGRCKVRIQGLHTDQATSIPLASLPWAQPLYPINNSFSTASTLREGDMVMGFFMDGDAAQYPVIMGAFHGIPEDVVDTQKGFNDPRNAEQLKTAPRKPKSIEYTKDGTGAKLTEADGAINFPGRLNEPTTSRLCRNETIDQTIVKTKTDSIVTVPDAIGGNWIEPKTPYKTKYPYNQVTSTESGHYVELDDTPGAERIHQYHRSGTFSEIHPGGTKVDKIVKDKYTIVMKDDNVYVMGECKVTVQGNAKVYVQQNCWLKVDGNLDFKVGGNWTVKVGGKWTTDVGGIVFHTSGGNTNVKAPNIYLN